MNNPPQITHCFGLFDDGTPCQPCPARQKCRAITTTHGLDLLSDLLDQTAEELPSNTWYHDTDRMSELIRQLREPPLSLRDSEAQMLGIQAKDGETEAVTETDIDI